MLQRPITMAVHMLLHTIPNYLRVGVPHKLLQVAGWVSDEFVHLLGALAGMCVYAVVQRAWPLA